MNNENQIEDPFTTTADGEETPLAKLAAIWEASKVTREAAIKLAEQVLRDCDQTPPLKLLPISELAKDPAIREAGLSTRVLYELCGTHGFPMMGKKTTVEAVLRQARRYLLDTSIGPPMQTEAPFPSYPAQRKRQ